MKNIIRIFLIISSFLLIVGFLMQLFLLREERSRLAATPGASKEEAVSVAEPPVIYQIPSNAIPTIDEIDASIKKTEADRKEVEAVRAKAVENNALSLPETKEEPAAVAETKKESIATGAYPGERKKVVFPTFEERKQMQSRGIVVH